MRSPHTASLELWGVRKEFGSFTAVESLDLTVPEGSFFALLGPSGCGKTTTLRMVAGLEQPTSGVISIGGRDVTGTAAHRRPVNTVFQSYALFPHLTVLDNVAFGLKRKRVPDARAKARAGLETVQLAHLGDRRPNQLSGGQQQRVALARALVNSPSVLLLDEPLGALDLALRREMQLELKRIQADAGITFVHVTHDQEEAMTMADTVAVMNEGRVEQLGPPAELYELPSTAFVANFLGRSNLVTGSVVDVGEVLGVDVAGTRLRVPVGRVSAGSTGVGAVVQLGVRPEKVRIVANGSEPTSGSNVLGPGKVTDVSFTGVSTQYQVDLGDLGVHEVFAQNSSGAPEVRVGDAVRLAWDVDHTFGLAGEPARSGQ
ncbi:spermidine/putrescine transport system ATP-binding protein [Promicromonospora sp. AC04]|uniref:ABC transporter ATP-binding protein n=1 Tax=Promicromonospora sp. AC04 TaxID=2135723 RepID=UPI000D3B03AF|nr:ABC transporter ATP-binding protein [Promicromonospora sp. AC04]PUB31714.1 spermidine/putrescine transport system ATP-binding protein [Promicromonospora sp. AC04]